jgi:hypothetical protein
MDPSLQDLSYSRLVVAIESNLFSWIPVLSRVGEPRENDPPGVTRSISGALPASRSAHRRV